MVAEETLHIAGILTTRLNITKEHPAPVLFHGLQHILWLAGEGVNQPTEKHIANFRFGDQAMTGFNCPRTGNQLMMDRLINFRLATLFCQPHAREWRV